MEVRSFQRPEGVKKFVGALVLVALLIGGLFVPTGDRVEFYDVEEMVSCLHFHCKMGLQPPPVKVDLRIDGVDLANQLRCLVPGSGRIVRLSDDFIIVRGTAYQHVAVRATIGARRFRNRSAQWLACRAFHVKRALCEKVFGMITK